MARRWPVLALALVAAPVGVVVGHHLEATGPPAPMAAPALAPDPALAALRAEVDDLRASLAALRSPPPARPDPAADPREELAGATEAADAAETVETVEDQVARYAEALAADTVDVAWAADAERRLREAFTATALADAALDDVTCRARLCRLALRFPTPQARAAGAVLLPSLVPWNTTGILHEDEDDPARAILYATRDGAPRSP